ncbi:MAG: NfeD family protein [Geminicoccaceae bacterium]
MPAWAWLILLAVALVLEFSAPGVAFVWFAFAAGVVALAVSLAPSMGFTAQVIVFLAAAVLGLAGAFVWRRMRRSAPQPRLNQRLAAYVGEIFVLEQAIHQGRGRIHIGDSSWPVRGADDLPAGTSVRVISAEGTDLIVESVQPNGSDASTA